MTGGGGDFLDEVGDTGGVVFNGEGSFEDVAMAVADEGEVFALGIVEGDAKDFLGIPGPFENGADKGVLIAIDGLDFTYWLTHGTAKIPC